MATLVELVEDHRDDIVVIAAGHPVDMARLVGSNPGLSPRFTRRILQDVTERQARRVAELPSPTPGRLTALEPADLPLPVSAGSWDGLPRGNPARSRQGVCTVGRAGVAMPSPMKNPVCGGWL